MKLFEHSRLHSCLLQAHVSAWEAISHLNEGQAAGPCSHSLAEDVSAAPWLFPLCFVHYHTSFPEVVAKWAFANTELTTAGRRQKDKGMVGQGTEQGLGHPPAAGKRKCELPTHTLLLGSEGRAPWGQPHTLCPGT